MLSVNRITKIPASRRPARRPVHGLVDERSPVLLDVLGEHGAHRDDHPLVLVVQVGATGRNVAHDARTVGHAQRGRRRLAETRVQARDHDADRPG